MGASPGSLVLCITPCANVCIFMNQKDPIGLSVLPVSAVRRASGLDPKLAEMIVSAFI